MKTKNLKYFLWVSALGLLLNQSAYAAGMIHTKKSAPQAGASIIHATVMLTHGKTMDVELFTYLGKGDKNSCNISKLGEQDHWSVKDHEWILTDGDALKEFHGLGYTCAKDIYNVYRSDSGGKTITLQYTLISDSSTYTDTDPRIDTADFAN